MGLTALALQYSPVIVAAALLAILLGVLYVLSRRGIGIRAWSGIASHRLLTALVSLLLLAGVGVTTYAQNLQSNDHFRLREAHDLLTPTNLVPDPTFQSVGPITSPLHAWTTNRPEPLFTAWEGPRGIYLGGRQAITSSIILVRPGEIYRYSLYASAAGSEYPAGTAQVRLLWLDSALRVLSWNDSPSWKAGLKQRDSPGDFYTGEYTAPKYVGGLRLVISNIESEPASMIVARSPKISQEGVVIERSPNGALGSLAFSFDWESAMGGAIHSRGMAGHDVAGATKHGMAMRQGTDWLRKLFADNRIHATFYATGYNLLDGNTERRKFSNDPVYKWANARNGWTQTDWWQTHPWYGDDPYGTVGSDPAWYFGDQTRALLKAGHEVASHTFGHLYVRGTSPEELGTDMGEWVKAAKAIGIKDTTTFAFPWRSSNSLTPAFYDVLHQAGISTVTRIYERDLRDLYTVAAASGLQGGEKWVYPDMSVMPDFLLGAESATMGEGGVSGALNVDQGLRVISETLSRRGTTSFWQHPEQLAPEPQLGSVRDAWQRVVTEAAGQRDAGRLYISTVAEIAAYERDISQVSAALEKDGSGWQIRLSHSLDHSLTGVTLTLPGSLISASSERATVLSVHTGSNGKVQVVPFSGGATSRQLVIRSLEPGTTLVNIGWAPGEEPLR